MPKSRLPHLERLGSFDDLGDEFDRDRLKADRDDPPSPEGGGDLGPPKPRAKWREQLPTPSELVVGLNEPQRLAVEHRGGPLLVVAGAGSGKTRVLTHRVAHLIAGGDVLPWEVLAITFTNKAADEMRDRLVRLVGDIAKRMWISTFHAACVRILRAHADRLSYRKSFTIYDDTDSRRLIEQIERELQIDTKRIPPRGVAAAISNAKAELQDPAAYRAVAASIFEKRIADVYEQYQKRLKASSAMDFDDLLFMTVELLRNCPDVLGELRTRFKHVLVDEYQDTNHAQNEIVLMLGAEHRNICVVGDGDQAIYGWRKADVRNFLEFERVFFDSTVIALEQNYRSTRTILEAANAVIANNDARIPKNLWTDSDKGDLVRRFRAEDEYEEAQWLAGEIKHLLDTVQARPGEVAVFYRTNAQSRALEEELVAAGIPYKVVGGTRFYDRREIKDMLAYLRVLANPSDEISARRIVNVPKRGVGDTSAERLGAWARQSGMPFVAALAFVEEAGVTGRAARGVGELASLLSDLRALVDEGTGPADLLEQISERTGYLAELEAVNTVEAQSRIDNVHELISASSEYEALDDFLESVALVSDVDEMTDEGGYVSLMTVHTAKGLEFEFVFIVGMEDGVFPHLRALEDAAQLEEERRLCYVGITRAGRRLYVSHAWSRNTWGTTSHAIPSRFLSELPEGLVKDVANSSSSRPDPLRIGTTVTRRPRRRVNRLEDEEWEIVQDPGPDPDEWHDPDPWRSESPNARPTKPVRGTVRNRRLPKMAEWRFLNDDSR